MMGQDSMTPEQRIQFLDLALRKAREENARLRKAVKENGHHARRVERAYDDALLLAALHVAYQPTNRDKVQLSKRRWTNAMGLLKLARVYNCRAFVAHSLAEIESALERAKRIALENPTSYRVRLPKHALE
ncbi:MAG: hypothetical protein E6Q97_25465 [Desulfurellales bacterium]|nr:MAG: hypothetical protein E6Q97_25465 [Desulfurellales bacterium]